MNYQIKGIFKKGYIWEKFNVKVSSQNEKNAIEKLYSTIGSKHHLERKFIKINSVLQIRDENNGS